MINPRAGYRELADILRDRILSGELQPGDRVPTERDLQTSYGVARETARRVHRELAEEGLIDVRHGYPSRVRVPPERTEIKISRYSTFIVRPATPKEREGMGLARGVKIVEVTSGGKILRYPDDRHFFRGI